MTKGARNRGVAGVCGVAAVLAVSLPSRQAGAATIAVRTTSMAINGSDGCGLVEAITAVNEQRAVSDCAAGNGSNDTITLRLGIGTYTMPTLDIARSVIIRSETANTPVVVVTSGHDLEGFRAANPGVTFNLQFQDIDLRSGAGTDQTGVLAYGTSSGKLTLLRSSIFGFNGGAVIVSGMDLDITDSIIDGNSADTSGGNGGGVFAAGDAGTSLNIRGSQITDNQAFDTGGGIYFAGGGASNIINSTISNNSATVGGGLALVLPTGSGQFKLTASTLAFNDASSQGGGVYSGGVSNVLVGETIIGTNFAPSGPDFFGTISSLTNSLLQSSAQATITAQSHNVTGSDPGFLNDFSWDAGGPFSTRVMVLAPSSPAVDFNSSSVQTEDQRHFPRGVDANPGGNRFDIGAYEHDRNLQTELLRVSAKSSDAHSVTSSADFSNGKGTTLEGNAVNDFVTYTVPMLRDDCSSISVGVRRTKNGARVQAQYNRPDVDNVWSPIGPVLDLWAASPVFKELAIVPNSKVSRDRTLIRFLVVGRNNANRETPGYFLNLDYVRVAAPTGPTGPGNCVTICSSPPCPLFD